MRRAGSNKDTIAAYQQRASVGSVDEHADRHLRDGRRGLENSDENSKLGRGETVIHGEKRNQYRPRHMVEVAHEATGADRAKHLRFLSQWRRRTLFGQLISIIERLDVEHRN